MQQTQANIYKSRKTGNLALSFVNFLYILTSIYVIKVQGRLFCWDDKSSYFSPIKSFPIEHQLHRQNTFWIIQKNVISEQNTYGQDSKQSCDFFFLANKNCRTHHSLEPRTMIKVRHHQILFFPLRNTTIQYRQLLFLLLSVFYFCICLSVCTLFTYMFNLNVLRHRFRISGSRNVTVSKLKKKYGHSFVLFFCLL